MPAASPGCERFPQGFRAATPGPDQRVGLFSVKLAPNRPSGWRREPVCRPHAQLLVTLHSSNSGAEFMAERVGVRGLVAEPSHGSKPSVDRSGGRAKLVIGFPGDGRTSHYCQTLTQGGIRYCVCRSSARKR
jgi:hypothetical protein